MNTHKLAVVRREPGRSIRRWEGCAKEDRKTVVIQEQEDLHRAEESRKIRINGKKKKKSRPYEEV